MIVTSSSKMNSNLQESAQQQAALWYARLRAPDCSDVERHDFQLWLEADASHEQAWQLAVAIADRVKQQAQHDSRLRALADAALQSSAHSTANRAACKPAAVDAVSGKTCLAHANFWRRAAVVVLSIGAAAWLATRMNEQAPEANSMASYANHETHEQRIQLEDGSVVHLDVGAELSVEMHAHARNLQLSSGRAYFEVAHDATRPFAVIAGDTRTVALGTRFQVAMVSGGVQVTLAQGSVAVSDAADSGRWREVLHPGQQLNIHENNDKHELSEINADAAMGWSKGRLIFDGAPLAQALDEFNRYASVKVSLGDASLANIPIGGNFVAGSSSSEFVAALTAVLPLRSVSAGANEIVLFQRYGASNP